MFIRGRIDFPITSSEIRPGFFQPRIIFCMSTRRTLLQDEPDAALSAVSTFWRLQTSHESESFSPPILRNTGFVTTLQRSKKSYWGLLRVGPV